MGLYSPRAIYKSFYNKDYNAKNCDSRFFERGWRAIALQKDIRAIAPTQFLEDSDNVPPALTVRSTQKKVGIAANAVAIG
jgi:hypothetical protein